MLVESIPTLDGILHLYAVELGDDFAGYRNHAYRVVNLCASLCRAREEQLEKIAIAAAFHDLGIWTARTFDYLEPSAGLASAHLARGPRAAWAPEVSQMIFEHHKISRYREHPEWLVEPFRRADWADVSHGLVTFGLPRSLLREVFAQWPDAGFHRRLVQLSLGRLKSHPWSPLPMLRL
jgi:hypothetical protein